SWARRKSRVRKAVRELTEELVKLYAAREHGPGIACGPDTPWQREFEDAFEYDETPDQMRAIEDVKRAMESPRCMDRLVCGDVGYGKTEVALRAAFKCVLDGRQAALLEPTTVLVQQHYTTFTERMAGFPVRIEMVSRFRTAGQQKRTLERLKAGEVDVVIGTHRIISKDVRFKNLGLVIIDEEHRFGVAHKEKLKQARTHVDVLSMSATPIPRTLHFSLMGIRDMSLINTAPNDRLPIHTCIEVWDERLVQEAITRELGRQGQVFYLHNRVQTIEKVAREVRRLVPRARVAIAHGQMGRHELEDVMTAFVRKEIDVLVCTTIIASGIDIPNANTIIIDRADMFGLADLYQIRGRVGRYKHRAFAYLLVPGDRAITEEAQQRLKALEEFSALGAGYRVAMRDLEIRGCGDILGAEQHGHIAEVGYETYKELLAEAVAEARGEPVRHRALPPFEVAVDAYIPEDYVPVPAQKISLYRRIAGVTAVEEISEMESELADRFGRPPAPVRRLIEVMRARALAAEHGVTRMVAAKGAVSIEFEGAHLLNKTAQRALREAFGNDIELSWRERPGVTCRLGGADTDPVAATLRVLRVLGHTEPA
ncbi:MAG TPA: transcription-repair coupling factor, partial [Candidatus Hydrogenedentes bacterium]|nr:transcription-repair coupling factor [Candidatus Hydrogenedentota bacterium]